MPLARTFAALATPALVIVLAAARLAWAGHGPGSSGSMNPWLEALLWGIAGLAVAMTVVLIVTLFTRAPVDREKTERRSR